MAKIVVCPSCGNRGSIPDDVQAKRIRCIKCKTTFEIKMAIEESTGPPKSTTSARRSTAPRAETFDDRAAAQPRSPVRDSTSQPASAPADDSRGELSQSPLVYAAIAIGGLAVVLLCAVLVVLLTRGDSPQPALAAKPVERPRAESTSTGDAGEPETASNAEAPGVGPTAPVVTTSANETPASVPSPPTAVDGPKIVQRLKEASVYILNKVGGKPLSSGTGFVIEVRDDTVLLATNRHVALPDLSGLPPRLMPKGAKITVEAVFRSGQGAQKEQALLAQIIAADTTDDFSTDLAILIVKGVKDPPAPLSVLAESETTEGMAYIGAGFPLGGMLSKINDNRGNPSVTITRGGIARLVNDDQGHLDLFQVDGSLQPGNSGGPIVEEKTGRLIGVAVAKVGSVDTIGFVVPAAQLRRTLAGRIGYLDMTLKTVQQDAADLEIKAQIVDPKRAIQAVMVHVAPASAGTVSPDSDGAYPPLPNTTAVELTRDPKTALASGKVRVALSGQGAAARRVLVQTAHRDASGQLVYAKPKEVELPERPGRVAVSNQMTRLLKTLQRKSLSMLPPLIDPEKDCNLAKSEDDMKIKIEIPGGKIRSLAPNIVQRVNKRKPLHNAPMTLIDVEGDFAVLVGVTGEISAGATLPKDRQGNNVPFTFQSAGILLYRDKDNFVRLERSAGVALSSLQPVHTVLFEVVKDGRLVPNQSYPVVDEGPVYLLLVRRKSKVMCGASRDLANPPQPIKVIELDLPEKVKVGLSASNISAKPFSAQFENFALINDETQLDAMFSEPESPRK